MKSLTQPLNPFARPPYAVHPPGSARVYWSIKTIYSKGTLARFFPFTDAVRCAIAGARRTKVWGNWQGYTVAAGVAWWEASSAPNSSFSIITVNNGGFYEGCSNPKSEHRDRTLFDKAMVAVQQKRYAVANLILQTPMNTYPDSEYADRAKLMLQDERIAGCGEGFSTTPAGCEQEAH